MSLPTLYVELRMFTFSRRILIWTVNSFFGNYCPWDQFCRCLCFRDERWLWTDWGHIERIQGQNYDILYSINRNNKRKREELFNGLQRTDHRRNRYSVNYWCIFIEEMKHDITTNNDSILMIPTMAIFSFRNVLKCFVF